MSASLGRIVVLAVFPLFVGCSSRTGRIDGDGEVQRRVESAVAQVYPALVQIHVVTLEYREGRELKFEAAGSGVIISSDGHVITNHHVVGKARRIRCTLANREVLAAKLVGTDPLADIAVVKLDLKSLNNPKAPLPVASFGDSSQLRVGEKVLAMGSPAAVSQSVTQGIVSNLNMTFPGLFWPFKLKLDGEDVGTLVKWIGHDAAIYGGNSGGPLVNLDGQIVGINEISLGLGGAIPGNLARDVADQIIRHGRVRRSWIGVRCQPLLRGSTLNDGVLVAEVLDGSPAARAGLRPGDIIRRYGDQSVRVRFAEQLPAFNRLILSTPIGQQMPVEILRGDRTSTIQIRTAEREPARGRETELRAWGITARPITRRMAKELKRDDNTGVYVGSVRPGGPLGDAKPGLLAADIIVSVNGKTIRDLKHLRERTQEIVKEGRRAVPTLVGFVRKGQQMLTVAKLGLPEDEEKPRDVRKAWFSAGFQVLTSDLARKLDLKGATGVRITQIYPNSTVGTAGLKVGDIITHMDGERITASQPEDIQVFPQMVRQYKIGSKAELTVMSPPKFAKRTVEVKLVGRPKPTQRAQHYKDEAFSFEARELTYMDRVVEKWPEDQGGALVLAVDPGGWAALAHLAVGDLILKVDGHPIRDAAALKTRMKRIAVQEPRFVTFFVTRDTHTHFVEMEPSWPAQ